jgi:hypothetical protein
MVEFDPALVGEGIACDLVRLPSPSGTGGINTCCMGDDSIRCAVVQCGTVTLILHRYYLTCNVALLVLSLERLSPACCCGGLKTSFLSELSLQTSEKTD